MKNFFIILILVVVSVSVVTLNTDLPGDEIEIKEINIGQVSSFIIGQSKKEILTNNEGTSFSPQPKSKQCSKNWINALEMNSVEKECLYSSNEWAVGSKFKKSCPKGSDHQGTIYFKNNKLSMVKIRCTKAI